MNTIHDPFCDLAHLPPATVVDPEGTTTTWAASGRCSCAMLANVRKYTGEYRERDISEFIIAFAVNKQGEEQDDLYLLAHTIKTGTYPKRRLF